METIETFPDSHTLAHGAAHHAITTLRRAIDQHGQAVWVLAGGTIPELSYQLIAEHHLSDIDWSKVTFVMGDERIVPLDSAESNWHVAKQAFLRHIPQAHLLRPVSDQTAEHGAGEYEKTLQRLPQQDGRPRFDLVWLGMGEDGHTLSLFPHHPDFRPTDDLVIPVHDSPKPPADRMTFTLTALGSAQTTVVIAAGENKASIIEQAFQPQSDLPIAQAARLTHATWLLDQAAARLVA